MDFDFKGEHILENEIVRLRPLVIEDFGLLLEFSTNEPTIWKYNIGGADGIENLKIYIENAVNQRYNEREYPFIVFDKIANKYVGSTRFYDFQFKRKTVEIGYTWYGKDYQGTGINKNCKFLMLDFAFEYLDMDRVGFRANSKNDRSINAMKSLGCTVEGILRSFNFDASGQRLDAVVLSILKSEWDMDLRDRLKNKISQAGPSM